MPVNFRPCQRVLCWLLPWLLCPLTVSPPILLCQLPVSCRARGVDWAGCEPKPERESKPHTLTHKVQRSRLALPVCVVWQFPYWPSLFSNWRKWGTWEVHLRSSSTLHHPPVPFKSSSIQYLRPIHGVTVTGIPCPRSPLTSLTSHPSPLRWSWSMARSTYLVCLSFLSLSHWLRHKQTALWANSVTICKHCLMLNTTASMLY